MSDPKDEGQTSRQSFEDYSDLYDSALKRLAPLDGGIRSYLDGYAIELSRNASSDEEKRLAAVSLYLAARSATKQLRQCALAFPNIFAGIASDHSTFPALCPPMPELQAIRARKDKLALSSILELQNILKVGVSNGIATENLNSNSYEKKLASWAMDSALATWKLCKNFESIQSKLASIPPQPPSEVCRRFLAEMLNETALDYEIDADAAFCLPHELLEMPELTEIAETLADLPPIEKSGDSQRLWEKLLWKIVKFYYPLPDSFKDSGMFEEDWHNIKKRHEGRDAVSKLNTDIRNKFKSSVQALTLDSMLDG